MKTGSSWDEGVEIVVNAKRWRRSEQQRWTSRLGWASMRPGGRAGRRVLGVIRGKEEEEEDHAGGQRLGCREQWELTPPRRQLQPRCSSITSFNRLGLIFYEQVVSNSHFIYSKTSNTFLFHSNWCPLWFSYSWRHQTTVLLGEMMLRPHQALQWKPRPQTRLLEPVGTQHQNMNKTSRLKRINLDSRRGCLSICGTVLC